MGNKILELEDTEKTKLTIVTHKKHNFKNKATAPTNQNLNTQNWQHKNSLLTCIMAV